MVRNSSRLTLLGVLLDGQRVDRADRLERGDDPRRLRPRASRGRGRGRAPLDAAGRAAGATRPRPAPRCSAGLPAASVSRTWSVWLSSLAGSSALRGSATSRSASARRPRPRPRAPVSASALAASSSWQRDLALGAASRHSRLLRSTSARCRPSSCASSPASAATAAARPRRASPSARAQPLLGRAEAARDVGLLHLPVHPLLAGRLLLGLELGQAAAAAAERLARAGRAPARPPSARRRSRPARCSDRLQPLRDPCQLRPRSRPTRARRLADQPHRRPRARRRPGAPPRGRARRPRWRRASALLPLEPGARRSPAARLPPRPTSRVPRSTSWTECASSARRRSGPDGVPAPREEDRAAGPSERRGPRRRGPPSPASAARTHAGSGPFGPAAGRPAAGRSPPDARTGIEREQDQGARLVFGVPRLDRA